MRATDTHSPSVLSVLLGFILCLGLVACSSSTRVTPPVRSSSTQSGSITSSSLNNARYTIVSPIVRRVLSDAGLGFSLTLRDGIGSFHRPATVSPYDTVRLDPTLSVDGDLNGDGERDVVGVLSIGDGGDVQTEVVAFTLKDGFLTQLATFPLGSLRVTSLRMDGRVLSVEALSTAENVMANKPVHLAFSLE